MKSLQEIITSLDQQLAYAEKISGDTTTLAGLETELEHMSKYVLVSLRGRGVAVPIDGLAEIGPLPEVTALPNLPGWIKGIVNLRGEIVSVIDLFEFLSQGSGATGKEPRLAVLQSGRVKVGVLVDKIVATVNRAQSELTGSKPTSPGDLSRSVFKKTLYVERDEYDVLDIHTLLNLKRLRNYYETKA